MHVCLSYSSNCNQPEINVSILYIIVALEANSVWHIKGILSVLIKRMEELMNEWMGVSRIQIAGVVA